MYRRFAFTITVCTCSLLVFPRALRVHAESTEPLTLQTAIREALANNPGLLSARKRVDAAMGNALQKRLWTNPSLELSSEEIPSGGEEPWVAGGTRLGMYDDVVTK